MKNRDKDNPLHPKPRKRTLLLLSHLLYAEQSFLQRSKGKMFWLKKQQKKKKSEIVKR